MDLPFIIGLLVITMASHGQVWYDGNIWQVCGRGLLGVTFIAIIILLSFNRPEWVITAWIGWSSSLALGVAGFISWRKGLKDPPNPKIVGRRSRQ